MGAVKSTLRGYLENPDNFGENNVDRIREAEIAQHTKEKEAAHNIPVHL